MLLWGQKSHRAAQSKRRLPWLTSPVATGLLQQRNKSTFPHPRALVSFCSIFTLQHIPCVRVCVRHIPQNSLHDQDSSTHTTWYLNLSQLIWMTWQQHSNVHLFVLFTHIWTPVCLWSGRGNHRLLPITHYGGQLEQTQHQTSIFKIQLIQTCRLPPDMSLGTTAATVSFPQNFFFLLCE